MIPRQLALPLVALLTSCSQPEPRAAAERGLCVRLQSAGAIVVERGVPNVETCAARLEVVRQQNGGAPLQGRYQTVRLYLDAERIDAAREDGGGPRFRVFEPGDLVQLREATRKRLEAEAVPRRAGPPVAEGLPPAP